MMEYRLIKEENTVVVLENGTKMFEAKVLVDGETAWLDSMYFSEEKQEELNKNESFIKGSFDFMGSILDEIKNLLVENGYEINSVTIGDFEEMKKYSKFAAMSAEEIMKQATSCVKRTK